MNRLHRGITLYITLILIYTILQGAGFFISEAKVKAPEPAAYQAPAQANTPLPTVHFSEQNPASSKPVLTWTKVSGAVAYELELLKQLPESPDQPAADSIRYFSTSKIYVNGFNADLSLYKDASMYWRVRGLDLEGKPLGSFSEAGKIIVDRRQSVTLKPIPTSFFNQIPGSTLLYPVYSWIPVAGAASYEVEVLSELPENPNGTTPSIHRIDSGLAVGFDYYDQKARLGDKPFYWRVRGLDQAGNPIGVYSDAGIFSVNPQKQVPVATFGDSITHGGGAVSYSPADWEYSFQHYLGFDSINLGKSGDTSKTMLERFEGDVLPFGPQYLIILGGTNSLRAGVAAEDVIADFKALRKKCLTNNILPVFLTLPPINPDNIKKVFNESTSPDWQEQIRLVNDYIRTQVHIDVAREMEYVDGILPTPMALDGLHLDIEGKKRIAATVNVNWFRITNLSWQSWNTK